VGCHEAGRRELLSAAIQRPNRRRAERTQSQGIFYRRSCSWSIEDPAMSKAPRELPMTFKSSHAMRTLHPRKMGFGAVRAIKDSGVLRALSLQLVILAAGFFSGALLARDLGPIDRGEYQVVALAYTMSAPILGFGLGSALSGRRIPRWPALHLVGATLFAGWATAAVAVGILFGLPHTTRIALILLLWAVLASPLTEAFYFRRGQAGTVQTLRVLDVAGTSTLLIVCAACGVLNLLAATLCLLVPTVLIRTTVAIRVLRSMNRTERLRSSDSRSVVKLAVAKYWPWDIVTAATVSADVAIGAFVLDRESLGIYAVAAGVGRLAMAPFSAVNPHIVSAGAQSTGWRPTFKKWVLAPLMLVGLGAAAFVLVAQDLTEMVYGSDFRESGSVAAILMFATLFLGATTAIEAYALGSSGNNLSAGARGTATITLVAVVSMQYWIGVLTIIGLAYSALAASVITLAGTLARARRVEG
jgi:hypothetical protein